jgi:hypothetical protein
MKVVLLLSLALISLTAWGQSNDEEVAKKLQNPVANLISVPFQFNFDQGIGKSNNGSRTLLNVQPVIPTSISENWQLINRGIMPFISQTGNPSGTQNGLGDFTYEGFFSPKNSSPITWGIGPVVRLPTGTEQQLSSRKWSTGPAAVALIQKGPWTLGLLAYQAWSIAGSSNSPEVNETYFQPFLNHTNKKAFTLGLSAEHTINNVQNETIGYGIFSVSQLLKIHNQRINFQLAYKHSYDGPEQLKYDWGIRAAMIFVFPE